MKTSAIALIAALAATSFTGAYAKPYHQITDAQRDDCLMTDNRGPDQDGYVFCVKSAKGMTQEQIDAWYLENAKKDVAERAIAKKAVGEPNLKNCLRAGTRWAMLKDWDGPPSKEECKPFAAQIDAAVAEAAEAAKPKLPDVSKPLWAIKGRAICLNEQELTLYHTGTPAHCILMTADIQAYFLGLGGFPWQTANVRLEGGADGWMAVQDLRN